MICVNDDALARRALLLRSWGRTSSLFVESETIENRFNVELVDVGTGGWDRSGRPSEVRVNRIIRVDPDAIRREGAVLARERFEEVATAIRQVH